MKDLTETVTQQLAAGTDREAIVNYLVQRGWPETSARRFVANVRVTPSAIMHRQSVQHGRWRIVRGLLLILLGVAIIAAGLALDDPSASLFVFSVGVILSVFGLLDFLFGISAWGPVDQ